MSKNSTALFIRMSPEERRHLEDLARLTGLSYTELTRRLIRSAHVAYIQTVRPEPVPGPVSELIGGER